MDRNKKLHSIGERWRHFVDKSKEYVVTTEEKPLVEPWQKFLPQWDWDEARALKKKLIQDFVGKILPDVLPGEIRQNQYGTYYEMDYAEDFNHPDPILNYTRKYILQNLKLVYGIGPITEERLYSEGYHTLLDLQKHPVYCEEASTVLSLLEQGSHREILSYLQSRLSRSHPNVLHLSGCHPLSDCNFIDIETLGLSSRPLILIGSAHIFDHQIHVHQYFVRSIPEEKAVLEGFMQDLSDRSVLFSFNGDSFDIPYIQERLYYYGLKRKINHPDYDILLFSRRKWKGNLPNCKLQTIEKHILGIGRENDVPGALVPEFYEEYLRTGNIGPIVPIIQHNRQDIITLARIYFQLLLEWT